MRKLFPIFVVLSLFQNPAYGALSVQITHLVHETCTYANGQVWVSGAGGTAPYTYTWADGPTDQSRNGLSAGSYTVTVTDGVLDQASLTVEILSDPYALSAIANSLPWCGAPGNILEDPQVSGTLNNWTVNFQPTELLPGSGPNGEPWYRFQPDGFETSYSYALDDGNGCAGTISGMNGPQITNWPTLTITDVDPSCDIANIGAIEVSASYAVGGSPFGPYVNIVRLDGPPVYQAYEVSPGDLVVNFTGLPPGAYAIHWWLGVTGEGLDPGTCGYDSLLVTVPSVGANCGSVQGTSFIDLDGDCTQDANESGIPYSPLLVQPGNEAVLTDGSGQFAFGLPNGNYTLEGTDPTLVSICPATQPVPFTVNSNITTIEIANTSTEPLDLLVGLAGTVFRPGFSTQYHVVVRNDSPQQSGPVTLTLDLDPTLVFVSSTFAVSNVNGNTITWDLPAFTSFQGMHWYVTVQTPVGTTLGTQISSLLSVSNTLPDGNLANNVDVDAGNVVGSYDPNDKRAVTSTRASEELYFVDQDEWIDYTIRFQNTGTFPAEFVVITDTIAPELDMLTFEQGVASHPFNISFKPGRVIEWRFDDIQLPDSTSDEAGSHGLVKFRMKPRLPLIAGTVIANTGNIYFDFNEPVITEPSVLITEFSTVVEERDGAALSVFPDPAQDRLTIVLPGQSIGTHTVEIIGLDGRVVHRSMASGGRHELDVHGMATGTYLIRVLTAQGTVFRGKVTKG